MVECLGEEVRAAEVTGLEDEPQAALVEAEKRRHAGGDDAEDPGGLDVQSVDDGPGGLAACDDEVRSQAVAYYGGGQLAKCLLKGLSGVAGRVALSGGGRGGYGGDALAKDLPADLFERSRHASRFEYAQDAASRGLPTIQLFEGGGRATAGEDESTRGTNQRRRGGRG
jgi:hypothetical protein